MPFLEGPPVFRHLVRNAVLSFCIASSMHFLKTSINRTTVEDRNRNIIAKILAPKQDWALPYSKKSCRCVAATARDDAPPVVSPSRVLRSAQLATTKCGWRVWLARQL